MVTGRKENPLKWEMISTSIFLIISMLSIKEVINLVRTSCPPSLQGDLLERCGNCLVKTLHLFNVVQYLELSLKYNLAHLKKECMDIVQCSKTLFQVEGEREEREEGEREERAR